MDDRLDISMLLHGAGGTALATRELALVMAETIFRNVYGEDEFDAQTPFTVEDGGDRWIIFGSRRPEDDDPEPGEIYRGRAEIEVAKMDCRVLKLKAKAHLPPPE